MTLNTTDIAVASSSPFEVGASEALENSNAAALCFRSHQDALDFARNGIEDANRRATFDAVEVVKCYKEGKIYVVLKMTAGLNFGDYDLILFSVEGRNGHHDPAAEDHSIDAYTTTGNADRNQESVFIGITQLVEGPQGVIPSLMRIERAK